jgi:hypothetical protein
LPKTILTDHSRAFGIRFEHLGLCFFTHLQKGITVHGSVLHNMTFS